MYNFKYMNELDTLLHEVDETNKEMVQTLSKLFAENIKSNHIIHTFGTGHSHMIGIELFCRAGGLANVNAMLDADTLTANGARRSGALEQLPGLADIIYDQYTIKKGDIIIITSNSGRNAVPIEIALRAKKEGVTTIALTSYKQSKEMISRHPSGKKLYECCDYILDNCVPSGDTLIKLSKANTGAASSISSMFLLNTIVSEALMILDKEGVVLPVFQSQNVDGFNNDALYETYEDRVKHF